MEKDFEILPHTADIKIRAYGKTLEEFFRNALVGMFKAIGPKIDKSSSVSLATLSQGRKIELEAIDLEVLLVNFLSEALYLSDVNNEAYLDAKIEKIEECEKDSLTGPSRVKIFATVYGIAVKGFDVVEIKAVTYNDLKLENINGLWQSDIVFDI